MHEENMELLLAEARRLLSQEVALLNEMADDESVVGNRQAEADETFTREGIRDDIEALRAEVTKIDRLEFVVAVVGTMKAGKSTVINAIVGTEVLPTRNRPMTALPTLIRHTPGATNPVLLVENPAPLASLAEKLRANRGIHELRDDIELGDTVRAVESGNAIKHRYEGAQEIRDYLETLNDLVRLSTELEEEFPFEDYDEIQELPVIEVEFAHLRELEGSSGSLVLLDTPGPNESDQPHLKKMLGEQLGNASGVMVVLDYTQLKSEADADVRAEVEKIASLSNTRMHALVNKFDQRDRHGDDVEELKPLIEDLMESEDGAMVAADRVFPVSAQWAYLSKRAQHELAMQGRLTDDANQKWIEDFGKAAFGQFWEDKILDRDAVNAGARKLWEASVFSGPLARVIGEAHSKTVVFILQSAADTLTEYAKRVMNFTNAREHGLDVDIKELEAHIAALEKDERELEALQRNAKKKFEERLLEGLSTLEDKANAAKRAANKKIEQLFEFGRTSEEKAAATDAEERRRGRKETVLGWIRSLGGEPRRSDVRKWDPKRQVITFKEPGIARDLVERMDGSVRKVMNASHVEVQKAITRTVSDVREKIDDLAGALTEQLGNLDSRLKEQGFELQLRLPEMKIGPLPTIARNIMNRVLEEQEYTVTRRRHRKDLWGRICHWWGTKEWGTEKVTKTGIRFVIDLGQAKEAVSKGVDGAYRKLTEHAKEHVDDTVGRASEDLFEDARKMVERIRGDLIRSRTQIGLEAEEKRELARQLGAFKRRGRDIGTDCDGLRSDLGGLA